MTPPTREPHHADSKRRRLSETFDGVAELYDRVRPGYPQEAIDHILAGIALDSRLLQIGCGTGQLTEPLAIRGYTITAVECGDNLARVGRRKLSEFPNARVVTADFERWNAPAPFDLVVAATAFHWLGPANRARVVANALLPDSSPSFTASTSREGPATSLSRSRAATSSSCSERRPTSVSPNRKTPSRRTTTSPPPGS